MEKVGTLLACCMETTTMNLVCLSEIVITIRSLFFAENVATVLVCPTETTTMDHVCSSGTVTVILVLLHRTCGVASGDIHEFCSDRDVRLSIRHTHHVCLFPQGVLQVMVVIAVIVNSVRDERLYVRHTHHVCLFPQDVLQVMVVIAVIVNSDRDGRLSVGHTHHVCLFPQDVLQVMVVIAVIVSSALIGMGDCLLDILTMFAFFQRMYCK